MLREKAEVSRRTLAALEGWRENALDTKETPGEMIQRVMPDLARMIGIVVMNGEGHHCYMEGSEDDANFTDNDFLRWTEIENQHLKSAFHIIADGVSEKERFRDFACMRK